ncbi:20182_t:CDS:2 [Gigaspora rosea]|nr:20182_t:CDS:2 [Gigaspora rosea]
MSRDHSEKVKIQKSFDSNEPEILIAQVSSIPKTKNSELVFPDIIISQEISLKRQWYLYNEVAQHIQNPEKRDLYLFLNLSRNIGSIRYLTLG